MAQQDNNDSWWKEFLVDDVTTTTFTDEQRALLDMYQMTLDERRLFQSIKTGRNLFLSNHISDEEILWNMGVMSVNNKHRGDMKMYRKSVIERLRRFDEAERTYKWYSGTWTKDAMRVLISQWTVGMMVVVPHIQASDGSPMVFTKEWYEHMPMRDEQPDNFWEFRTTTVYPLMARSICRAYPMATRKGLVSVADMTDFDHDKYDMEQKMRHSNIQAVIPNKLRRMISINPDEKMKEQLKDFKAVAKKYGFVMYETYEAAVEGEAGLLPSDMPTWVGGSLQVDIQECLRYLFRREPDALALMEQVYQEMEGKGEILHPKFMQEQPH